MRLLGKRALITGGGIGIGQAVALRLAQEGADIVVSYNSSSSGALATVDEVVAAGRRGCAVSANLSQVAECRALIEKATRFLGGLDILVNNAGQTLSNSFYDVTERQFDEIYNLNIRGQFFCAQEAARIMREQGQGVIINMLSMHALGGRPGASVYAGTKGAILSWTKQLGTELASDGIRVVGVAPGAIEVPRFFDSSTYDAAELGTRIPIGRVGQPSDIAGVCAFLASDDAAYVTSTIVIVDGGLTGRLMLAAEKKRQT